MGGLLMTTGLGLGRTFALTGIGIAGVTSLCWGNLTGGGATSNSFRGGRGVRTDSTDFLTSISGDFLTSGKRSGLAFEKLKL